MSHPASPTPSPRAPQDFRVLTERQQVIGDQLARGRSQDEAEKRAEAPAFYKTFYVPQRARWEEIRDHLHKSVGSGLNKALEELEHSNRSLDGVLQHIDFNRKVGQGPGVVA